MTASKTDKPTKPADVAKGREPEVNKKSAAARDRALAAARTPPADVAAPAQSPPAAVAPASTTKDA